MKKWTVADRLKNVGEYYFSKKLAQVAQMRAEGADIINLGIGSPDGAPDPQVVETLTQEAQKPDVHGYTNYKGEPELMEAVAQWYKTYYGVTLDPATQILSLFGSKEGLSHIMQSYINAGDKVLVPNPGYPAYAATVELAGGVLVEYPLTAENDWMPQLDKIDTEGVKVMVANYPNMPTGKRPTRELFQSLVDFARTHGILLVHDNPYSFIRNPEPMSILSVEGAHECCVELNSLSKSHNMAGWRVGFMMGCSDVISTVLRYKSNLNNSKSLPMQRASVTALSLGDQWYDELNKTYRAREVVAQQIFDRLGVSYQDGQSGLFLWGQLPQGGGDCYEFCDRLLYDYHIFMTPGGIFGDQGNRFVRISLCSSIEKLNEVLDRLKDFK